MAFERGHALVIGVGAYAHHPEASIPMASGDARELEKVLADRERCGYLPENVTLLVDEQAGRDALLAALDGLAGLDPEDTVLLFYSGHGALEPGGGYALSAHDAHFSGGRIAPGSGVSEGELLERLRAVKARRLVLFINACYAGELSPHLGPEEAQEVASTGLPDATAYAILGSGEGRIIIASSRENQRSWGRAGQPTSLFGQALADGLRGRGLVSSNGGYISAYGLYEHLYETVKEAATEIGKEQEPEITVLKGVGPFPLALYQGSRPGSFDAGETLPEDIPARWVAERTAKRAFDRRVIHTGGAPYFEGDVNIGRDAVFGNQYIFNPPAPDPDEIAARQREKARKAYLEGLNAACQAMRFAALGGDDSDLADIRLDDIYIELDTTATVEKEKKPKTEIPGPDELAEILARAGRIERPVSALEAAAGHERLVLLGAAGSGKSTFAKRLLSWLACARLNKMDPPPGFGAGWMPVLVTLRHLAQRLSAIPGLASLPAKDRDTQLVQALRDQVQAELRQMDLKEEARGYGPALLDDLEEERCVLALDGLDEVPLALRERVRQAVLAAIRRYPKARVLVTCRVRSYQGSGVLPGFTPYSLAPLDRPKMEKFCRDWYSVQARNRKIEADKVDERASDLVSAASNPDLQDMPSNPMLLTSMALLHQRKTRLPRERVKLFEQVVDLLILRWQEEKAGKQAASEALLKLLDDKDRLRPALDRLGYETHRAGDDLPRWKAQQILESRELLGDPHLAIELLDYADQRAGLLAGYGGEDGGPAASYGFPHRLLQEYLAGCYLVTGPDLLANFYTHAGLGEGWDLPAQLGMEELCFNEPRQGKHTLLTIAYHLCPEGDLATGQQQRAALWAAQIAVMLGEEFIARDTRFPNGGEAFLRRARQQTLTVLGGQLPAVERAEAGRALARLGDPRAEVLGVEAMPMCFVPPGPFQMGEDREAHTVELPGFWLGQYPVTNAQYSLFVKAEGYKVPCYWKEAEKAGYWKNGLFKGRYDDEGRSGPYTFSDPFGLGNHPVVGVNWYEALAYTRWLDELARSRGWLGQGWQVVLPSEAEWEKAARGGPRLPRAAHIRPLAGLEEGPGADADNPGKERSYPWDGPFDPGKANTEESGIGATSAVGCFPGGASPYGCQDLSGNVWEWTRILEKDYPYDPGDAGREDLKVGQGVARVLRGGSFRNGSHRARCSYRFWDYPNNFNINYGFRVGVVAPIHL